MFWVLGVFLMLFLITTLLLVLQVCLCKKSTKLGLVLPAISLILSIPMTVFIAFNTVGADPKNILVIIASFLAANILTILFGGICLYYMGQKITAMT